MRRTAVAIADILEQAARSGRPVPPLRDRFPLDAAAAYAVQAELATRRESSGAVRVGRKIGLTSVAVQRQLGVSRPDFGVLFADMQVPDGGVAPFATLIQPKVEAEIAFVLGEDLDDHLELDRVRAAIAYAQPALEIVDSRIAGWDIGFVDTVADNGSSALFVLGESTRGLDAFEPRDAEMTMYLNGEIASRGAGSACLDDPLLAVLWLAQTAVTYGDPLRAGDVVLSGALGPMAVVHERDSVRASITGLGDVSVEFARESGVVA
jgi:2-keto-4-pentenoate hydratase